MQPKIECAGSTTRREPRQNCSMLRRLSAYTKLPGLSLCREAALTISSRRFNPMVVYIVKRFLNTRIGRLIILPSWRVVGPWLTGLAGWSRHGRQLARSVRGLMSKVEQDPVQALYDACQRDLGDPDLWYDPDGYPDSLALCIIDSIYSTGAHYSSVVKVVGRYRKDRATKGGNADADGTAELLASFIESGGPDLWASKIGNRRPTSTSKGAPLKAEAIQQIATNLSDLSIRTTADLRSAAMSNSLNHVKSAWTSTAGQRSGITWDYALMLARIPGVKADRMVVRYVTRAVGRSSEVSSTEAATLVRKVADRMKRDVIRLDHAIWRFESGRPVNEEGDPIESDSDEPDDSSTSNHPR